MAQKSSQMFWASFARKFVAEIFQKAQFGFECW